MEPGRRYLVVLEDRLGPFRLRADLDVAVRERIDGRSIHAAGDGEDRQVVLAADRRRCAGVSENEDGTELAVSGTYEVTGRPAALGAASIRKKAAKILAEFLARVEHEVTEASSS